MNKTQLAEKIKALEGLSNEDKSALLALLHEHKKYGIVWEDKPEDVERRLAAELPVLTEVPERYIQGATPDAPNHIIIEGDNLHALTALTYTHEGKIDVIYIDPPYNTGNKDFVYNDSFVDTEDSYRHSKWLSFMNKRLKIAKRLLSDRGVIFISIDDNEQAQLKLLCDEIFGPENFRNILISRRRTKSLNSQFSHKGLATLNVGFEYILVYANSNFLMKALRQEKENVSYKGRWDVFWSNADRPTMRYELLGFTPLTGQWRNSKEKALIAVENYSVFLRDFSNAMSLEEYAETTGITEFIRRIPDATGKNGGVQHWIAPSSTTLRTTNWTDIEVSQIAKEIELPFNNPKNRLLIQEIIKLSEFTPVSTVLDFFAGSGTTLHATMQLNAEDGGKRQCILVTNNENGICENVTYERNKRVINGYTTPKGTTVEGLHDNALRYYKTEFVPAERTNRNRRALMAAATDMLCIMNNVYAEETVFCGQKLRRQYVRYFCEGEKRMLVVYDERMIEHIVPLIRQHDFDGKIKVYVYSPSYDPFAEEWDSVSDKVELCALPQAIYNAYKNVITPTPLPDVDETNREEQ